MGLSTLRRSRSRHINRACLEALEARQLMSFTAAVNYAAGTGPQDIVTADFNNDGRLDVVVANPTANSVNMLLGNGNGTFQAPKSSAAGDNPISVAVGDFNNDGKLDLAAANGGTTGVSVMRGNGDGTFQAPVSIDIGADPASVAVGDFNGDGKLDLAAVSNTYQIYYGPSYYPGYYEGYVNVLLGSGSGSFAAPTSSFLNTGYHTSAAAADLNGDNIDDFVAVNADYGYVAVALGSSTGDPLGYAYAYATGWYPQAVTIGDFTGDGVLDLATAGQTVDILPGLGDGTFQEVFRQNVDPSAITAADFNADGKLDVVTADPWAATVSVMLGHGDATLTPPIDHAAGVQPIAVAAGDFNGDGRADVAAANAGSGNVSVLLNNSVWPAFNSPSLSIIGDPTITEGNTGTLNAVFTVTLSAPSTQAVTVNYATADGISGQSATAGADYQTRSGQITIPAGQTSATIAVPVVGDRLAENTETFSLRLTDPTNAFIADGLGFATIVDNEPRISINNVSKSEGNAKTTTFTFTVSLSAAYDQAVTVNYKTTNGSATAGSDYQAKTGSVTFAPGETIKTITIVVNGDKTRESNETFFVDLFGPSSNALINTSRGVGTIFNDDRR